MGLWETRARDKYFMITREKVLGKILHLIFVVLLLLILLPFMIVLSVVLVVLELKDRIFR